MSLIQCSSYNKNDDVFAVDYCRRMVGGGIRDTLRGGEVLVTGGTGFMGKVLIEKLLRSTEVSKIHVVIRPKRGLTPAARLANIFGLPVSTHD